MSRHLSPPRHSVRWAVTDSAHLDRVSRLIPFLRPYTWAIATGFACLLGQIAAELFPPLVWKFVVDTFLRTRILSQLLLAIAILAASYAISAALSGVRTFLLTRAAQGFIFDLRRSIYSRLQTQPLSYFQDRRTGDLVSRAINDVEVVQDVLISGADMVLASGLRLIGVAFIFIYLSRPPPRDLMPSFGVAIALHFFNSHQGLYAAWRELGAAVTAKTADNLAGMPSSSNRREDTRTASSRRPRRSYYTASVESGGRRSRFFRSALLPTRSGIMLGWSMAHVQGRFTVAGWWPTRVTGVLYSHRQPQWASTT